MTHDLSHTQQPIWASVQLSPCDGPYQFVKELDVSQDCSYVSIARRPLEIVGA